jgi:transposase InsO family protein
MPEDRNAAEDRDDLARERREQRRMREEWLEDQRETYATTED